jgi:hypothetical protein
MKRPRHFGLFLKLLIGVNGLVAFLAGGAGLVGLVYVARGLSDAQEREGFATGMLLGMYAFSAALLGCLAGGLALACLVINRRTSATAEVGGVALGVVLLAFALPLALFATLALRS